MDNYRIEYYVSCEYKGESYHKAFGTLRNEASAWYTGAIRDGATNVTFYSLTFDNDTDECIGDETIATH